MQPIATRPERRPIAAAKRVRQAGDTMPEIVASVTAARDLARKVAAIGPDKDVILWGFTAGIIARLFSFLGWDENWDRARVRDLPDHMLQGEPRQSDLAPNPVPNTRLEE